MIVARHEVPGTMRKIARPSGTIEPISCHSGLTMDRPSGTGTSLHRYPRHFVPGYYQPVPPGQKPFARRSA
jgi:hypothetical protein